jgi:NitT/TauT family transport system permease protein
MIMDTFGCTPKFLADNPKAAQALANSYFEAVEMIKRDPKKSFEIMGADVKQSPSSSRPRRSTCAGRTRRRTRNSSRSEHAAFSMAAAELLMEMGIIKSIPDTGALVDTRVHQIGTRYEVRGETTRAYFPPRPGPPGRCFFRGVLRGVGDRDPRRVRVEDVPADPVTMLREGYELFTKHGFIKDVGPHDVARGRRLRHRRGAGRSAGIAMGAWKPVEAFFEPFISFSRYLPPRRSYRSSSCGPGSAKRRSSPSSSSARSFPMVLMIAVKVGATRRDLVEAAYTLGCDDWGVVRRVLLPASAPEIAEILRTVLGWAWTYVIVAELIGSERGIGHMITDSQALLNTGQIIFGILVIGVIGLVSDYTFKSANRPRVRLERLKWRALHRRG